MSYNILVINWQDIANPYAGGAEVHCHEIFKRIARKGHKVTLLCCHFPGAKSIATIDDIHIVRCGNRALFNLYVPRAYKRLLEKNDFDIVVDDVNKIPFYTPLFVKKPVLGIIHHLFGRSIYLEAPPPIAFLVNCSEKLVPLVYRTLPFSVVSQSTKNELIRKGFDEKKIHIIYNGVDMSVFKVMFERRSSIPTVGYFGRIKKYKSVHHLLQAFKKVLSKIPQAQLLIMGDGDYLPTLKKLAVTLDLERAVTFTGSVWEQQKVDNLNTMWITVNPSPKEGWGLTVIESNACGVPVIAADSPGLRDSVIHDKTGILYPYGDIDRLAEHMVNLLTQTEKRQRLSMSCLEWARNFNWDLSAEKMLSLIEHIIRTEEM